MVIQSADGWITECTELLDDLRDELGDARIDRLGPAEAEVDAFGDDAEQHDAVRVSIEQSRSSKEIGDPDLMRGETLVDGGRNLVAFDSHQRTGRRVRLDRIDQDHLGGAVDER